MLAKIHLKTACGCTKEFFEKKDVVYPAYLVPLRTGSTVAFLGGTYSTYTTRKFLLAKYEFKSKNRVELWYEEEYA